MGIFSIPLYLFAGSVSGAVAGAIGGAAGEITFTKAISKRRYGKSGLFRWPRVSRSVVAPGVLSGLSDGFFVWLFYSGGADDAGQTTLTRATKTFLEEVGWLHSDMKYIICTDVFMLAAVLPLSVLIHRQPRRRFLKASGAAMAWRIVFDIIHHFLPWVPLGMLDRWGTIAIFHALLFDEQYTGDSVRRTVGRPGSRERLSMEGPGSRTAVPPPAYGVPLRYDDDEDDGPRKFQ